MDLAQPGVLAVPRVVHRHRPLGQRVERELVGVDQFALERLVVERQRVEVGLDALRQVPRRPAAGTSALRGEAELLQHLGVQVHVDRLGVARHAVRPGPLEVALVPVTHVLVRLRQLVMEHAVVLRVHLPLPRVRLALEELLATLAAPAGQEADTRARRGLEVDDEVRVVAELAGAGLGDEGGQPEARTQFDQHVLERFAVTLGRHDRDAHRVARPVELGDRPVEHRQRVVALEVGRVRQYQVGERDRLRLERVGNDDERDLVLAVVVLVDEHLAHLDRVHRRVPRHVGHEQQQRVDLVRVAAPRVGDDVVHQAVHRQRVLPRERLVEAHRVAVVVDEQVVGVGRPTERHAVERRVRLHTVGAVRRLRTWRDRARKRRLVTKAAGAVDRAEYRHQHAERADRLEAVRVRGEATHRMECDRAAADRLVLPAPDVGPLDRQLDLLVARGDTHLVREAFDRLDRDAGDAGGPRGRVFLDALLEHLERGLDRPAGDLVAAKQERVTALAAHVNRAIGLAVPPQFVLRIEAALLDRLVGADEHAVVGRRLAEIDQLGGIRVMHQELAVVQALLDDLVRDREHQRTVGTGLDRHPFVGDRRVAGAHRVDRDEAAAATLELRDRDLERVRVVVLGGADHDEQLGAIEVGATELPERTADRVDQAGGHVHRAEAAVRGVVGRAELLREHAGQRLHLVTPGEQRELLRVLGAQPRQALRHDLERLVPGDLVELRRTALAAGAAQQRPGQARRRVLLHDAGCALGADHALVQRVVRVALDMPDLAVAQRDTDAATARAHVAGRVLDLFPARLGFHLQYRIQHAPTPSPRTRRAIL